MSLPGVKTLLQGDGGTGKTFSLGTAVEWKHPISGKQLQVFYFAFEAGAESLAGYFLDPPPRGKGTKELPSNLHIITVKPPSASWDSLAENVKLINTLSNSALRKVTDVNRSKYDQFEKFLRTFNDVTDDKGQKHGSVDKWDADHFISIDGMTGLCRAAAQSVCGGKIDRDQSDFGLMMGLIEEFLRRITDASCKCHLALLSHVEPEIDEVNGGRKITVSVPGKKLAPKIPPMFSDVIACKRLGKQFVWDLEDPQYVLKTRNLPIESKLPPNFGQILDSWARRGGVV
jgi:hypothetical protein